ncbi:hypothetical protein AMECASPLE_019389 [Ameca splendens]|uniref:Peptide-N-glycosidase F N-terminal domain-containing protein n=1 Tax=Ameca splendens TaxID=208324 RepID=A0ABV0ZBS5_9TELE
MHFLYKLCVPLSQDPSSVRSQTSYTCECPLAGGANRGTGHWLTDVSPLIPLLDSNKCTFTMKTVPWAMPWVVSLNLRFSVSNQTGKHCGQFNAQPKLRKPLTLQGELYILN